MMIEVFGMVMGVLVLWFVGCVVLAVPGAAIAFVTFSSHQWANRDEGVADRLLYLALVFFAVEMMLAAYGLGRATVEVFAWLT